MSKKMKTEWYRGAFPIPETETYIPQIGLSKLEYAAIHIAAGLCSDPNIECFDDIAETAVAIANKLEKELAK